MIELNDLNFEKHISSDAKSPILIDFWTFRCESCRYNAPIIDELANEFKDKLRVGKLNVDNNPYTVGRYGIKVVPSVMVFLKGQIILRMYGASNRESVIKQLIEKKII